MSTVQIMLLPPPAGDGLPQVLLEDGGIWRDMTSAQETVATQTEIKMDLEQHLAQLMKKVGDTPRRWCRPMAPASR